MGAERAKLLRHDAVAKAIDYGTPSPSFLNDGASACCLCRPADSAQRSSRLLNPSTTVTVYAGQRPQ